MTQDQSASRSGSAVFTDATTEQKAAMFEWLRQVSLAGKPPEWFHAGLAMHELNRLGGAVSELTQSEPPYGLLVSIALRLDHSLFLRSEISGETEEEHKRRIEIALLDARRAWEECTGHGFYRPEREAEYANHLGLDKRFERTKP